MIKQNTINDKNERGVIINIASVAGIEGNKDLSIYSSSKGAIIGMYS
jgi:short-subunit dehydrogenase